MNIIRDTYLRIVFSISSGFILIAFALIYTSLLPSVQTEGDIFIIHFSGERGIDLLSSLSAILGIVTIGAFIVVLDAVCANALLRKYPLFARLLSVAAFLVSFFVLLFVSVLAAVN